MRGKETFSRAQQTITHEINLPTREFTEILTEDPTTEGISADVINFSFITNSAHIFTEILGQIKTVERVVRASARLNERGFDKR